MKTYHKYLIDEYPLMVFPSLAKIIGLNQSIILQQIHYWIINNKLNKKTKKDKKTWCYNSYKKWQKQFPFWSQRTIQREFLYLEKEGLVISANHNNFKTNKTKWYRINYTVLNKKIKNYKGSKFGTMDDDKLALSRQNINRESSFKQQKKICVSHETPDFFVGIKKGKGIKEKKQKEISAKLELHPFATKALSIWNTLPNITAHKKPSKVWLEVIKSLNMLKSGKLYKNHFEKEFLKKYNIPENILRHKFTKQEIIITLKKVSEWCQQGFLIQNKSFPISLPQAIYTPYSFYQSVFLVACMNDLKPTIQKIENKFPEITDYFQKRTHISLDDKGLNQMCKALNQLFDYHTNYILRKATGYHINKLFGDFKSMCKTFIDWLVDNDKLRNTDKDFKYSMFGFNPDSIMFKKFIKYYEKTLNCNLSSSFSRF